MLPTLLLRTLAPSVFLVSALACGTADTASTTGTGGAADDGRYHPEGNGTHIMEDAACDALTKAQQAKRQKLKCPGTSRVCPGLLRVEFKTECLEYDEGSVQGCVAHYDEQTTCDDVAAAIDNCVVTAFAGSEPKGCP